MDLETLTHIITCRISGYANALGVDCFVSSAPIGNGAIRALGQLFEDQGTPVQVALLALGSCPPPEPLTRCLIVSFEVSGSGVHMEQQLHQLFHIMHEVRKQRVRLQVVLMEPPGRNFLPSWHIAADNLLNPNLKPTP